MGVYMTMYIYMYTYVCVSVYVFGLYVWGADMRFCVCVYDCVPDCNYVYLFTCLLVVSVCTYTYIYIAISMYTYNYIYIYVRVCASVYYVAIVADLLMRVAWYSHTFIHASA